MKNIRLNRHLQPVRECIGTRKSLFFTNYSNSAIHFCSNALAEGRITRPSSVFTFVTMMATSVCIQEISYASDARFK